MEKSSTMEEYLSLSSKCFINPIFSLSLDIWRDLIVSNSDLDVIVLISQTCHFFKEIVDNIGRKNFNLALMLRKEGQIVLARKHLLNCAENNPIAMFHVGYAHCLKGWALKQSDKSAAEWFKKSAELGNAYAMAFYSHCLYCGDGVKKDKQMGKVWGQKALSSNNAFAKGCCYYHGLGTDGDPTEAFAYFEAAAKEGDEYAQDMLGTCLQIGDGCEKNQEHAFYWTLKSAEQGNSDAMYGLATLYQLGEGCSKDIEKAIFWYKKSSRQEDRNAKFVLEKMGISCSSLRSRKSEACFLVKKCFKNPVFSLVSFEIWRDLVVSNVDLKAIALLSQTCWAFRELVDGLGEKNFNLALLFRKEGQIPLAKRYLFKSACNNNSLAMFHIGFAFRDDGWGLKADEFNAADWFRKSAECGNARGAASYSRCLRYGLCGVEVDIERSNFWSQKALESNDSFSIGSCYYYGLGTDNEEKSLSYFESSAKEGDEFGQMMLAHCLFRKACKNDDEKVLYWYLKSAEQGNCTSALLVAELFWEGKGCKDIEQAIIWYKKAAKQGNEKAENELEKMGIKDIYMKSRKDESSFLLTNSFKNPIYALVSFEIWRDLIVSNADLEVLVLLSQTCWAFKEILDSIGENNFNLALLFRKEEQNDLALKYLFACAEKNNQTAMFHLGYAYFYGGWGLSENKKLGCSWFKKLAEFGNGRGMAYYSCCLCDGFGVEADEELSNFWGQKALSSNDLFAVGLCHSLGLGTDKDDNKAFAYFVDAASNGDEFAQLKVGEYGNGCEENSEYAHSIYSLLLKLAEHGNCKSMWEVGDMFDKGLGCEKDFDMGNFWLKKSAKQGLSKGKKKLEKRQDYFEDLLNHAELNRCNGNHALAICYRDGYGCDKDIEEAVAWFKKSADQGFTESKRELEKLGIENIYLRSRKSERRSLLKKSFQNPIFSLVPLEIWRDLIVSYADVQSVILLAQTCWGLKEVIEEKALELALMLRKEGQIEVALRYLFKSAENNNSTAMFHLGYACVNYGWGLSIIRSNAVEWFKKSAELGNFASMAYYAVLVRDDNLSNMLAQCNLWAEKALSSDNALAIGFCYYFGVGTEQDLSKALSCFEASANEGDEFGQYHLGRLYDDCDDLEIDLKLDDDCNLNEQTFYWYMKGAEKGNCLCEHHLAKFYSFGWGCEKDEDKAVMWHKKAEKQLHLESSDALARYERYGCF